MRITERKNEFQQEENKFKNSVKQETENNRKGKKERGNEEILQINENWEIN
jgi:hypothetical protein